MNTHETMVSGVFRNGADAQRCYDALHNRGLSDDRFSLIVNEQMRHQFVDPLTGEQVVATAANRPPQTRTTTGESRASEGVGLGGALGTVVGGSLAAIAAVGTSLVIPGLNLIVAGPLVAALAGGGAGAVTGGVLGGLVGLGISEDKAETYNKALREGCTVLGVALHNDEDVGEVKQIMKSCSAENIFSS
jgi:hypothetical protein